MSNTVINTNVMALNSHRALTGVGNRQARSSERLSTGQRINRAADDAAGLAISEKMRAQVRGLDQATRNSQDGISLIQTAEGALQESQDIVQRIRELTTQAANDTLAEQDRTAIETEINLLVDELVEITRRTEFNGIPLLSNGAAGGYGEVVADPDAIPPVEAEPSVNDAFGNRPQIPGNPGTNNVEGSLDIVNIQNGSNSGQNLEIELPEMASIVSELRNSIALAFGTHGTNSAGDIGVITHDYGDDPETPELTDFIGVRGARGHEALSGLLDNIDNAIRDISNARAGLGANQNRLEHTVNNLQIASENTSASESRIRDTDMAREMMQLTQANVLQQAATSMLAQANQSPQGVLQLLN